MCRDQIGNNKKHKAILNRQLAQGVFFCKILKSLSSQNTPFLIWSGIQFDFSSKHNDAVGRIIKLLGSFTSTDCTKLPFEGKTLVIQPRGQCDRGMLF